MIIPQPYPNQDIAVAISNTVTGANAAISSLDYTSMNLDVAILSLVYDLDDSQAIELGMAIRGMRSDYPTIPVLRERIVEVIYNIKAEHGALHSN